MFILWRGYGLAVLAFAAIGIGLGALLDSQFQAHDTRYLGIGAMIGGVLCTLVGIPLIQRHRHGERHDLYFVPVVAWGPVMLIIGLGLLLSGLKGSWEIVEDEPSNSTAKGNPEEAKKILDSLFVTKDSPNKTGTPGKTTATDGRPPEVPAGFAHRPTFILDGEEYGAGSSFAVTWPGQQRRVLILSALHLLGPSGGLDAEINPREVPERVTGLVLHDAFSEAEVLDAPALAVPIPNSAPLGSSSECGDVIAFWVEPRATIKPLPVAKAMPRKGDVVYLAGHVLNDEKPRTHRATVKGTDEHGCLHYIFDTHDLMLRATSGAAMVNAQGEVFAINLGGYSEPVGNGKMRVTGVGNPVSKFRAVIDADAARPPRAFASNTPRRDPATLTPPVDPEPEPSRIEPPRTPTKPPTRTTPQPPRIPDRGPIVQPPPPPAPPPLREPTMFDAEFKARVLAGRLRSEALRNKDVYPAGYASVRLLRDEDKKDPWGDEFLYFGAGKKRVFADRSKTLLIATAKAHDGKRVVAYLSGDVETVSEETFQKMAK